MKNVDFADRASKKGLNTSRMSSPSRKEIDIWAEKSVADMTVLVDNCVREIRKAESDLQRWKARAGTRPSEKSKEERKEIRTHLREQEVLLAEYEGVREMKIPFYEKLPKDTTFY